jgi:hypothetical protein
MILVLNDHDVHATPFMATSMSILLVSAKPMLTLGPFRDHVHTPSNDVPIGFSEAMANRIFMSMFMTMDIGKWQYGRQE